MVTLPAVQRAVQSPALQRSKKKLLIPGRTAQDIFRTDYRQSLNMGPTQQSTPASSGLKNSEKDFDQTRIDASKPKVGETPVFRNEKGNLSGVTVDGKDFLGLNPEDVNKIVEAENRKKSLPAGAVEVGKLAQRGRDAEAQAILEQQQAELAQEGVQEREAIRAESETFASPADDAFERNILAGVAVARALTTTFGGEIGPQSIANMTDEQILSQPALGRGLMAAFGLAGNIGVGKVRFSSLFAPESASLSNLQGDAKDILKEQRFIIRMATTKGADVSSAIQAARGAEAKIRQRFMAAQQSLRNSPQDRAGGLDLSDSIQTALIIAQGETEKLRRYSLTLDPTEILTTTGEFIEP